MSAQDLIQKLYEEEWLNLSSDVQSAIIRFENEGVASPNLQAFRNEGYEEIANALEEEARVWIQEWLNEAPSEKHRQIRLAILKAEHGEKYQYE